MLPGSTFDCAEIGFSVVNFSVAGFSVLRARALLQKVGYRRWAPCQPCDCRKTDSICQQAAGLKVA